MNVLDVQNLHKSYGPIRAVEGVSFTVDAGEVFGLLGPNGAGKSTTMMMVCGALKPDDGTIQICGTKLTPHDRQLRRLIGIVPQDLAVYPEMTARENLAFFGRIYGLKGSTLRYRISDALDRTGLAPRADDPSGTFSGGMKRRLNFGVALLHQPRILILDEPTVGIDPQSRSHLLESVRQLTNDGMAVIYASHYMEEVQAVCDRVAIVDQGRVVAEGPMEKLLSRVASELRLRVSNDGAALPPDLAQIAAIERRLDGDTSIVIDCARLGGDRPLSSILTSALAHIQNTGGRLESVQTTEPNLERLFLELTGNSLRD
ncbi:ABC transporter ATP-binding protein [Stratiformator vulcanicus]|uniref:Daunorubicin/doxorubicin resistance ATP-binding protein DrrA n=1 Tax=Stratiformator vulcanicus TaxID=2527980 RepID=A0A517R5F1_9PLAN|nr:ABC transporter ATP-binding protein [Stratiformator vulcanicus]QDT39114.1 Daunorubicin/doxorubicin resistance ATP-binding protein DrrA [Stratiformator vulcanicus]